MAAKVGQVIVDFALNTAKLDAGTKSISKSFQTMGKDMMAVGKTLTTTITLPLVAAGAVAIKFANDFDNGMDKIRAATGATGQKLADLGVNMRNVLKGVPAGIGDTSIAISDLNTRLGLTGKPLEDMATQMLNLARITGSQVGPVVADVTRVFGQFNVAAKDQAGALDTLFKASQSSGIGINKLMAGMTQYGAQLQEFGFGVKESAALLALWEKSGINAEGALAGLSMGLGKFAKAGLAPAEALRQLQTRMDATSDKTKAMGMAIEAFGTRSGAVLGKAMIEGKMNIEEFIKTLDSSGETINKAAEETLSFSEQMQLLKNRVALAIEPIGVSLLRAFDSLMPYIQKALDLVGKLSEWFAALPAPIKLGAIAIAGLAAAIGPVLMILGQMNLGIAALIPLVPKLAAGFTAMAGSLSILTLGLGAVAAAILIFHEEIEDAIVATIRWMGLADKTPEVVGKNEAAYKRIASELKISTQTLEEFTKTNKNAIPILGQHKAEVAALQEKVKSGAMTQSEYESELRKLISTTPAATGKTDELLKKMVNLGTGTATATDGIKKLRDETNKALNPMTELASKIENQVSAGFSKHQIVKLYADEILNASQKQRELSGELSDGEIELRAMAIGLKIAQERAEGLADGFSLISQETNILDSRLEDMLRQMEDVSETIVIQTDLWGWWKKRVKEGDEELFDLGDITLPRTKEQMGKLGDETKKSAEKMTDFGRTVSTTLTNMTQSIADKVIKWGGLFGDFAKGALSSFTEGLFGPLIKKFTDLGNWLSNWINGILGKLGNSLMNWVTGSLGKLLGIGAGGGGLSLGSILGGGGGLLGTIFGGGGTAAAATAGGAGAAGAAGGAAAGGGLGSVGSAIASFATNPITIAIAGAALAGFGIYKLIGKIQGPNSYEAAAEEAERDFGVSMNPKGIQALFDALGVSEPQAWDIRKSLLSSPGGLLFMAKYAEEQNVLDKFIARLANVQTSWGSFEFKTPFVKGLQTGDWSDLNAAYVSAFSVDKKLNEKLPNWRSVLLLPNTGTAAAGEEEEIPSFQFGGRVPADTLAFLHRGEMVVPANNNNSWPITINYYQNLSVPITAAGGVGDLVQEVKSKVIPILKREMLGGNTGLREAVRLAYDRTVHGF